MSQTVVQIYFPGYTPPPPAATPRPKPEKKPRQHTWVYSANNTDCCGTTISERKTPVGDDTFFGPPSPWGGDWLLNDLPIVNNNPPEFPLLTAPEITARKPADFEGFEEYCSLFDEEVFDNPILKQAFRSPNRAQNWVLRLQRFFDCRHAEDALKNDLANKRKRLSALKNDFIGSILPTIKQNTTCKARPAALNMDFGKSLWFFKQNGIPEMWLTRRDIMDFLDTCFPVDVADIYADLLKLSRVKIILEWALLAKMDPSSHIVRDTVFCVREVSPLLDGKIKYVVDIYKNQDYQTRFSFITSNADINGGKSYSATEGQSERAQAEHTIFLLIAEYLRKYAIGQRKRMYPNGGRPPTPPTARQCSIGEIARKFGFHFDGDAETAMLTSFRGTRHVFAAFSSWLDAQFMPSKCPETILSEYLALRAAIAKIEADLSVFTNSSRACAVKAKPKYARRGKKTGRDSRGRARYRKGDGEYYETGFSGVPEISVIKDEKGKKTAYMSGMRYCNNRHVCFSCDEHARKKHHSDMENIMKNLPEGVFHRMVTLTYKHTFTDLLSETRPLFSVALNHFLEDVTEYTKGLVGFAVALDTPFTDNGWHLHAHVAIFTRKDSDLTAVVDDFGADIWADCCKENRLVAGDTGFVSTKTKATYLFSDKSSRLPDAPLLLKKMGVQESYDEGFSLSPFIVGAFALSKIQAEINKEMPPESYLNDPVVLHYLDYVRAMFKVRKYHIDESVLALAENAEEDKPEPVQVIFFDNASLYYDHNAKGEECLVRVGKTQADHIVRGGEIEHFLAGFNAVLNSRNEGDVITFLEKKQKQFGQFFILPPPSIPPAPDGTIPPESASSRRNRSLDGWISAVEDGGDFDFETAPYIIQIFARSRYAAKAISARSISGSMR